MQEPSYEQLADKANPPGAGNRATRPSGPAVTPAEAPLPPTDLRVPGWLGLAVGVWGLWVQVPACTTPGDLAGVIVTAAMMVAAAAWIGFGEVCAALRR